MVNAIRIISGRATQSASRSNGARFCSVWALAVTMLVSSFSAFANADAKVDAYLLQPGDVVEMSVAGVPGMNVRSPVQLDGMLAFPAVPPFEAQGKTISDVRGRIQNELASHLLPTYAPDGREVMHMIDRGQVSVTIVEYRPIFISGDVARPGELPFRPRMTVRQAFAAAGGLPLPVAAGAVVPVEQLRADGVSAWQKMAALEVRVWRLRTELGEAIDLNRGALSRSPGSEDQLAEIVRLETELKNARAQDHERQKNFLAQSLAQVDNQADLLQRQLAIEKETEEADSEDLAHAMDLSKKGLYTQSRMLDLRTAALVSSTRRLQTESSLMQLEWRRAQVRRDLERLEDDRHVGLLSDLQGARGDLAAAQARLEGINQQLRLAGAAPVGVTVADEVSFSISRTGGAASVPATYETELQPGDVLDVHRLLNDAAQDAMNGLDGKGQASLSGITLR